MFNIAKKATKVKQQFAPKPDKKTQMGISVIEVLMMVAILLLLMVALYRTIGRDVDKARDADRKNDLKEIKIAFENYYNDKGCYPPPGSLDDCGGTSLAPYLAQIPCDKLGQPYLYLPVANAQGASCGGYRILTALSLSNDPMIEQVGCPLGCGNLPEEVEDPERYNYGIAEGIPLRQAVATPLPTPEPGVCEPDDGVSCYCCNNPPANCNVFDGPPGECKSATYFTIADCVAATACTN